MGEAVSETKRVIDLTVRMAQRSISSEFKGTALGRLWSFINPLATIAVYALIFGVVFSLSMLNKVQTDLAAKGWTWGGEPLPIVTIFRLNPAELFLEAYRSTLYGFAIPSWQVWLGCTAWAFGIFGLGSLIFRRFSARIVEEL